MSGPADSKKNQSEQWKKLIGLGDKSISKSYYPELQERLEELESFRALMEQSNDAFFLLDVDGFRIIDVSGSAASLLKSSSGDIKGLNFTSLMSPRDAKRFGKALETDHGGTIMESQLKPMGSQKKDSVPVEMTIKVTHYGGGKKAVVAARDISERKTTEKRLLRAKEKAEEASRIKSEFLANMSHEIRTPLNGVLGMLQVLEHSSLTDEQKNYVGVALSSGQNLMNIINDILDLSRIEAGKAHVADDRFNLHVLMNTVIFTFAQSMDKKLDLYCDISPETPVCLEGDPVKLRQILFNLVGNAIKFTKQGHVRLKVAPTGAAVDSENIELLFSVEDTGIGIPKEDAESIFESFVQVDGSYTRMHQGTGLGLAIVKRLVTLQGGDISVESKLGQGSTFMFRLKYRQADTCPVAKPPSRYVEHAVEPLRVLMAEDNPVNLLAARKMLEKIGHEVQVAVNGRQALDLLEKQEFDLVLMDIQMPEMDGLEAARRIRRGKGKIPKDIPIIAMTAHSMKGDREKFLKAGMNGYIAKPVDMSILSTVISEVMARK